MRRGTGSQPGARTASLLAAVAALFLYCPAGAVEVPRFEEHHAGEQILRQLRICAAFDILHLTSIEDAGRAVGADHQRIATAALELMAARQLCREGRFGESMEIHTRLIVEQPSAGWFR